MSRTRILVACLSAALAFVLPFAQPVNVHSQTNSDWTPGAIPMGSRIGPFAAFPAIKGQPYTAEILQQRTTVLRDGSKRVDEARNIHRRDSGGRLLDEQLASPHVKFGDGETFTQHGFVLVDPIGVVSTQWDDDSRTVVVGSFPVPPQLTDNYEAPCPPISGYAAVVQKDLGEHLIHGLVAVGCRTTATTKGEHAAAVTVIIETWRSPVLRIPLLTTEVESDGMESRTEVIRLEVGEPDQTKFEPPKEYKHITAR